jgi:hypothetical protein
MREAFLMTFTMPSGHRVRALPLGGSAFEFTTQNGQGQVISTVRQSGYPALRTLAALEVSAR